jgi:hypothetical protein
MKLRDEVLARQIAGSAEQHRDDPADLRDPRRRRSSTQRPSRRRH